MTKLSFLASGGEQASHAGGACILLVERDAA